MNIQVDCLLIIVYYIYFNMFRNRCISWPWLYYILYFIQVLKYLCITNGYYIPVEFMNESIKIILVGDIDDHSLFIETHNKVY